MAALVQRQLPNLLSGIFPPFPHHTETTDFSTRSAGLATETVTSTDSISSAPSPVISLSQASPTDSSSASSVISPSSSAVPASASDLTSPTTPSPTPDPAQTTSADVGAVYTTVTPSSASSTPSIQAAPTNGDNNGFLQNKALSGIVFAVVGVVALVLIVAIATLALRRSRKKRLHDEAVNFNPSFLGGGQIDRSSVEKRRFSLLSSDNGHSGRGGGFRGGYIDNPAVPAAIALSRQDPYRYPASQNQHNLIAQPQRQWYGGVTNANYGAPYAPSAEIHPAWMYGSRVNEVAPSNAPIPSDRAKSPESINYPRALDLKVTNA